VDINDILKAAREGTLGHSADGEIQSMIQACHAYVETGQHWAQPLLYRLLSEVLRRRLESLAEKSAFLAQQMDRLVAVAQDLKSAAERMERQTDKIIKLTRWLLVLTFALLAFTAVLALKDVVPTLTRH
jgi:hypothetical protein